MESETIDSSPFLLTKLSTPLPVSLSASSPASVTTLSNAPGTGRPARGRLISVLKDKSKRPPVAAPVSNQSKLIQGNESGENLTEREKYDEFLCLCVRAANLVSKCVGKQFLDKCKIIKDIISSLEKNVEVVVISNTSGEEHVPNGTHQTQIFLCLDGNIAPQIQDNSNPKKITCKERRTFPCTICSKMFKTAPGLKSHSRIHTIKIKKPYECQVCNENFEQSSTLDAHLRTHTGEKPEENAVEGERSVLCDMNSRVTNSSGDAAVVPDFHEMPPSVDAPHILTDTKQHDDHFKYQEKSIDLSPSEDKLCLPSFGENASDPKCSSGCPDDIGKANTKRERKKKTNVKLEPKKKNTLKRTPKKRDRSVMCLCHICSKMIKRVSFPTHLRIHSGVKPYECKVCHMKFGSTSNLKSHMAGHSEERPYECTICDKKFSRMRGLKEHLGFHKGLKPYECGVCSKKFRTPSTFKKHARVHTGERPFECTVCNSRFTQKHCLDSHVATYHTEERPFACPVCDKKFVNRARLNTHFKNHIGDRTRRTKGGSHSGKKLFECSFCNKKFYESCELEDHARVHTGDMREAL